MKGLLKNRLSGLILRVSGSVVLGGAISNEYMSNADAAGQGPHFENY